MGESIAAVVVSFNRKVLLTECLDALLRQTRPVDAIYILDNASTDGTEELLRERGYLDLDSVSFVGLTKNVGGAGGFHDGMEIASRKGHNWIWLMDDDAEPFPDALERMISYTRLPQVAAVANRKLAGDRSELIAHTIRLDDGPDQSPAYKRLRFSSFVGLLVSRSTIERIGLPKKEFFVYGDDNEYCRRIIAVGDIAYADNAVILHKEELKAPTNYVTVLGRKVRSVTFRRFCMEYFLLRNLLWIERHSPEYSWRSALCNLLTCARKMLQVALVDKDHRILRIRILYYAYRDGFQEKFDNSLPFRILSKHAPLNS